MRTISNENLVLKISTEKIGKTLVASNEHFKAHIVNIVKSLIKAGHSLFKDWVVAFQIQIWMAKNLQFTGFDDFCLSSS